MPEAKHCIRVATHRLHLMLPLLCSKLLPTHPKWELCFAIVLSIFLWGGVGGGGAASWSLHSTDLALLSSFHHKSLRRILNVNMWDVQQFHCIWVASFAR